ncbi:MAG TPA: alkaline phosphatase family protein, partial [bacterium]|nr:alkaline phosphatase family protein [bacterium]
FYTLYDFTSSPLTSGISSGDTVGTNPQLVDGTKITDAHTFGVIRFSGKRRDRVTTMETWDEHNKKRWSFSIHENDLHPAKK